MHELIERWSVLAGHSREAERLGLELIARWSQPHRHYHNLDHLRAVLDAVDELAADASDPDAVRLAAWFHDAVYDGRPGDDEERSAALAVDSLTALSVARAQVDEVARLVLLTAGHDPGPADMNGAVLCDADLSILGSDAGTYAQYAVTVRREYAHVPDRDFRVGRREVLNRILARDPIFHTGRGRLRWETTARLNIARELAQLSTTD